jgi:hypothetical protein
LPLLKWFYYPEQLILIINLDDIIIMIPIIIQKTISNQTAVLKLQKEISGICETALIYRYSTGIMLRR